MCIHLPALWVGSVVWAGPRLLGQEESGQMLAMCAWKKPSLKVTQTYGVETQAGSLLFPVLTGASRGLREGQMPLVEIPGAIHWPPTP